MTVLKINIRPNGKLIDFTPGKFGSLFASDVYMSVFAALTCRRCGHEWIPRKTHPSRCPRCKSLRWNIEEQS